VLRVLTSNRAVSLQTVAMDIVKVANRLGIDAMWHDRPLIPKELKMNGDRAIVVMAVDVLNSMSWFLFARDYTKAGVRNVFYGPIEGRVNRQFIQYWMREITYVAVSNYVRERLLEAGFRVIDVVPHGIDLRQVLEVKRMGLTMERYLSDHGLDPRKHFIILTIANSHPRKGLAWYDKVISIVEKKDPSVKFLVITEERGLNYFNQHQNLVVTTDFGRLPRQSILALIGSVHVLALPSLSEGFGLPVLEAMTLGTPCVHASLPPIMEFSTGFVVPVRDVMYFDKEVIGPSGILFEQHLYEVSEFADVLLQVIDLWKNKKESIIDWRAKSWERALQYDIYKVYPRLLRYVVPVMEENVEEKLEAYDFSKLPPTPETSPQVVTQSV